MDGRTRESRLLRDIRKDLIAHCGGSPSTTQRVLIDRAAQLTLQVALMDEKQATAGLTERDGTQYLAWTNTLTRLMRQLGLKGIAQRAPTLPEIHAAREAARRAQAAA